MKSLELNWIRKKVDKTIPMPEVIFWPLTTCSGKYYPPEEGHEIFDLDDRPHSMCYGAIIVNPEFGDEETQHTIAHEWRHHWQYYHGIDFGKSPIKAFDTMEYEDALLKYFTTSDTELDALRFQYKYSGVHDLWEEVLLHLINDLRVKQITTYGNTTLKFNKQAVHSRGSASRHSHKAHKKARRV